MQQIQLGGLEYFNVLIKAITLHAGSVFLSHQKCFYKPTLLSEQLQER